MCMRIETPSSMALSAAKRNNHVPLHYRSKTPKISQGCLKLAWQRAKLATTSTNWEKKSHNYYFMNFAFFHPWVYPAWQGIVCERDNFLFNQKMESCLGDTKDGSVQYITPPVLRPPSTSFIFVGITIILILGNIMIYGGPEIPSWGVKNIDKT